MKERKSGIIWNVILGVSIFAISIMYVSLIFNPNIWTDEAYTIELVSENTVKNVILGTANDVHPPLYYLIVKCFVSIFGNQLQVYKLVSILPMLLTMVLAITNIKPWFGGKTAMLFILFLNAIPCVMEYGVQVRMYSWALFFMTLCGVSAYGIWNTGEKKHWVLLTLSAMAACYTHNFAMISAVFIYVLLGIALWGKKKTFPIVWLLSGCVVGCGYLPWLFVLFNQTKNRVGNYWIEEITGEVIKGYFTDLFGTKLPYTTGIFVVLLGVIFCLCVFGWKRRKVEVGYVVCLIGIPFFTALTGVLVSIYVTPFFIARYLIPCMGLLALAFAIALGKEEKGAFLILCLFLICMTGQVYQETYKEEYENSHTEELLAYMQDHLGEKDVIIYNYEIYGFIYACYFDKEQLCFLSDMDFSSDEYETIWYFDSCISPWLPSETLETYGLEKQYIDILGIEQNDFILYKLNRK